MAVKKFSQAEFDVTKWLDSEAKGADTCGSYDFCGYCEKTGDTPCALAYDACKKAKAAAKKAATPASEKKPTVRKTTARKPAAKKATK